MMTIELRRGRFLRLANSAGRTLTAHTGSVWITEEDNRRDFVLRPGQSLKLGQPGVALVEAFSDASISISQSW